MLWWGRSSNPSAYDDDWEDQPGQGPVYQWGLGVVVPLALIVCGAFGIITRQIGFGGRGVAMTLHNANAIAFGVAWVAAGAFLHCHYFWGNIYDQAWGAVIGKIVSAIVFIVGMGYVLVRVGVFNIH